MLWQGARIFTMPGSQQRPALLAWTQWLEPSCQDPWEWAGFPVERENFCLEIQFSTKKTIPNSALQSFPSLAPIPDSMTRQALLLEWSILSSWRLKDAQGSKVVMKDWLWYWSPIMHPSLINASVQQVHFCLTISLKHLTITCRYNINWVKL